MIGQMQYNSFQLLCKICLKTSVVFWGTCLCTRFRKLLWSCLTLSYVLDGMIKQFCIIFHSFPLWIEVPCVLHWLVGWPHYISHEIHVRVGKTYMIWGLSSSIELMKIVCISRSSTFIGQCFNNILYLSTNSFMTRIFCVLMVACVYRNI